jgi:hypothetical protein
MDSGDSSAGAISVYAEAKGEYTNQLCVFLINPLQRFFLGLLETARVEEQDKKKVLKKYQDLLSQIPDWNIDKVARETTAIQEDSKCDYLEELLTAVFIAHTKVLSAIRLSSKNKSIQITVPKLEHFLHRTLSESARRIWSNVYLLADNIPTLDKQRNLRQIEILLGESIQQAVRGLLPVKNLLRDYLSEPDAPELEGKEEEEAKTEPKEEAKIEPKEEIPEAVESPTTPVVEPPAIPVVETPATTVAEPLVAPEPPATPAEPPTIMVDTEPRVHFSDYDTVFNNGKTEIVPSIGENNNNNDDDDVEFNDTLRISDEIQNLSMNDFENLDSREPSPVAFEEL